MSQEFSNKEGLFNPRRIRSFVRREGKLTKGQQNALNGRLALAGCAAYCRQGIRF